MLTTKNTKTGITPAPRPDGIVLDAHSGKYVQQSIAKNTEDAYRNAWNDFVAYCGSERQPLPALPQTIVDYLTMLADSGAAVATIDQRIAAIAHRHKLNHLEDPTLHAVVRALMKGIRRDRAALGQKQKQAAPLTREDLFLLVIALPDDLRGKRDRAILLLGFACARRESELAELQVSDIQFKGSPYTPSELCVTIRKSKTDQAGEGRTKRIPRLSDENELICPVRAVRAWLDAAEITDGALFRKVDRWNKVWDKGLNKRAVEFIVKRSVTAIGRDADLYSGHSLRAGFVTTAAEDGTPLHEIMDVTDHKSMDMVRRYIRNQGLSTPRTIKRTLGE